ncbi:hypothetical protein [Aeoliella sp. SH292]|uniref:hypothetical protein n=1 Tax=Aeoliella sp. SH292 TaxID=3454464 RepID=UPI003F9A7398
MTDTSKRRWRPFRFSIRGLLLLTLVLCCVLAYRLQPLLEARQFAADARSANVDTVVARLPSDRQDEVRLWLCKGNRSTWHAEIVDSPWQVIVTGKCTVIVHVRWSQFSASGSDDVVATFTPRDVPTLELRETSRELTAITII